MADPLANLRKLTENTTKVIDAQKAESEKIAAEREKLKQAETVQPNPPQSPDQNAPS